MSVDVCQYRMLEWVSIFALCDILVRDTSITALGSPPNDQVLFVVYPTLLHVKLVNAAASRASSSRLKILITLSLVSVTIGLT